MTITQQLITNKYLNASRTLDRKFKEAENALELEKHYTKWQMRKDVLTYGIAKELLRFSQAHPL